MTLLSSGEVARRLGVRTTTLARWRREGKGPTGWVYRNAQRVCFMESLSKQRPRKDAA